MSSGDLPIIDNYIYFYHLENADGSFGKFCILPLYPESIQDSNKSDFSQTQSLARSAPVFTFSHSGPREVNFNFTLHRDMMNDVNKEVSNLKSSVVPFDTDDYIDTLIKHLQSAALPNYRNYSSGSKSVIPPMVAIRFGNEIFIKGVVTSSISCNYKKPILYNKKYAQVEISFSICETDPYDADITVQSGSFRGLTATFKDGIYRSNSSSDNMGAQRGPSSSTVEEINGVIQTEYQTGQKALELTGQKTVYSTGGGRRRYIMIY